MWVKWLGGGVMLLTALLHCYQYERQTASIKARMASWITLLTHVRAQISCFGTPLSDIISHADKQLLAQLDINGAEADAATLLERCRSDAALLPDRCGELLLHLADELGTVWRQEQTIRLDYYVEALREEQTAFCAGAQRAVKLRRTLCLCGTLGAILLVW